MVINRRRAAQGELWQSRFFDRAPRSVKEYNEKVECLHLNPVRSGLARRPRFPAGAHGMRPMAGARRLPLRTMHERMAQAGRFSLEFQE